MDKVICAHYEGNFVVDHECQHGVMSGTAADFFEEVDAKTYHEARHKDVCLQHKGRLMFCPECEQRLFSGGDYSSDMHRGKKQCSGF